MESTRLPVTVALLHTSPTMVPVFKSLVEELLPDASVFNMVDESLLRDIIREGRCPPSTARRLVGHVLAAEQAGAGIILVTCSSMGPAVEAARPLCSAIVLRVDEPMADNAIAVGRRIVVLATLPSTLAPTVSLIESRAARAGKTIELRSRVIDGAFAAVISGDGAKHDALVSAALREESARSDVLVLAQASMARVVDALPAEQRRVPVLSSPRLAVQHLATLPSSRR